MRKVDYKNVTKIITIAGLVLLIAQMSIRIDQLYFLSVHCNLPLLLQKTGGGICGNGNTP